MTNIIICSILAALMLLAPQIGQAANTFEDCVQALLEEGHDLPDAQAYCDEIEE